MKNLIILFCFAVLGAGLQAQQSEFDQLYSAFRGEEGVINLYIPGFLCRMAGNIPDIGDEEQELLRSIKSVKLMVIENPEINRQINLAKVLAGVKPDKGVVPLLRIADGQDDVLILAKEEEQRISELYVVVGGDENVMIRIKGRMDKDLMKSLYDVTGIEETKYAKRI
jgi:hypothetical protein